MVLPENVMGVVSGVRAKRRKRIAARSLCPSVCNRLICTRTLSCRRT